MFLQHTVRGLALYGSTPRSLLTDQLSRYAIIQTIRGTRKLPNSPVKISLPPAKAIWNKLFGKYLLATNVISSGILMVVGDVMAQEIEFRRGFLKERYDKDRMWRMFVVGSLQGPLHHYAYRWMDKLMPDVNVKNTLKKIAMDELIVSPLYIFLFFYPACLLENKSLRETTNEVISKFPYIYIADLSVWPAVQFINFQYLESKYRVIFVNVVTAVFNVFMSYIKHDDDGNFLNKFI